MHAEKMIYSSVYCALAGERTYFAVTGGRNYCALIGDWVYCALTIQCTYSIVVHLQEIFCILSTDRTEDEL